MGYSVLGWLYSSKWCLLEAGAPGHHMLCYFSFCTACVGRLGKIRDSNQISTKRGRGQQEINGIPQELFKLNLVAQLGFIHMLPHRINTLGLGQHLFSVFVVVTVFFVCCCCCCCFCCCCCCCHCCCHCCYY